MSPPLMDAERPYPAPHEWDRGFWDAAREHRLVVQRCADCGAVRNFPRPLCPVCLSARHEWAAASGAARLYTWTTIQRAFHPAYSLLPHTVAIVALDDFPAVHLATSLGQIAADDPRLVEGAPLVVAFEPSPERDLVMPVFRFLEQR